MKIEIELDEKILANDVRDGISYGEIKKAAVHKLEMAIADKVVQSLTGMVSKIAKEVSDSMQSTEYRKQIKDAVYQRSYLNIVGALERDADEKVEKIVAKLSDKHIGKYDADAKKFVGGMVEAAITKLFQQKLNDSRFQSDLDDKAAELIWDVINNYFDENNMMLDVSVRSPEAKKLHSGKCACDCKTIRKK